MKIDKNNYSIECFLQSQLIDGRFKSKGIERRRHLYQVIPMVEITGHVMEFGVYRGKTMKHISRLFAPETCWGFDSFVGLPEAWCINSGDAPTTHPAGKFKIDEDEDWPEFDVNVSLVKGWFEDTLPTWLKTHSGAVKFLHVDCDLYSSTKTVLTHLNERIVPGTVIVFDEMYPWQESTPYDLWYEHEYKALGEWVDKHDREFEPLLHSRHQQCSIKITR